MSDHHIQTVCDHNGVCLARIPRPGIISMRHLALTLDPATDLSCLVLCDLVLCVFLARLVLAVCAPCLRNVLQFIRYGAYEIDV